eukprot:1428849-Prymnesium_polylepis.1
MHLEQLVQLLLVVRHPHLPPERVVEAACDRQCDRRQQNHERPHDADAGGADAQAVARADGLRDDLAEYHDDPRREQPAHHARRHVGRDDRDQRVDQRVAEEQRAQQVVAALAHGVDLLRPPLLLRVAARHHDVQPFERERQQPEREAREAAGHADQDDHREEVREREGLLGARHRALGEVRAIGEARLRVEQRRRTRHGLGGGSGSDRRGLVIRIRGGSTPRIHTEEDRRQNLIK